MVKVVNFMLYVVTTIKKKEKKRGKKFLALSVLFCLLCFSNNEKVSIFLELTF